MANYPSYFPNPYNQPQQPIFPITQTQMPLTQTSGILGRYVTSESEITAQDVAMGAAPSLFPLNDGSAIIAKQWANDGTIHTIRYSAVILEPDNSSSVSLLDIVNQLNNMQDMLEALQTKPTTRRAKKEVGNEETE